LFIVQASSPEVVKVHDVVRNPNIDTKNFMKFLNRDFALYQGLETTFNWHKYQNPPRKFDKKKWRRMYA